MKHSIFAVIGATALLGLQLFGATGTVRAADPTPVDLVDALNGLFGKPQGTRSSHAKGLCLAGQFTPSPEAAKLSKAAHFAKPVPITARFSLGGGNPNAPDNVKGNVRGLAIRFDLGGGAYTDLVMISAPMFFAFGKANPETAQLAAWLNSHPVPASYAGVNYWAIHAFTFTNDAGEKALVKYRAVPKAGELGLSDEEAASKPANFYDEEVKERLGKGPVSFELQAIRGRDGDQTADPTQRWDDEDGRETTPLGKVSIEALAPAAKCDAFSFLPGNVTAGIAGPADDPIFQIRSADYAVSFSRRQPQ